MSTSLSEADMINAIKLLDGLLAVEARQLGAAAKLPAIIRVIEELEPAGGFEFPVFPASHAGSRDNDPPVYDLSGIVYGNATEPIRAGKGRGTVEQPQIIRADRCTLDSPQSQANRMELAFLEDEELRSLVPEASVQIPRADGKNGNQSVLLLPHRVADFRVRLSDKKADVEKAISDFAGGNALALLRLMPTSILFGFWDSRGEGHKHARILLSRIDAFDVVPCRRHALYSGPYAADEFAKAILDSQEASKDESDKMAERGYTNALSEGLGGVIAKKIERLALVSLTDIARLWCKDDPSEQNRKTNAARRYTLALAALAEGFPRSTGSHRLRSGCELITNKTTVDVRGGDGTYDNTERLKELFRNRAVLKAVAENAKKILEIPSTVDDFNVSKESLKADFDGTNGPVSASPAAGELAPPGKRTARRTSR